jgi:pimeloyl-ACP methyl ester carboxylesterase
LAETESGYVDVGGVATYFVRKGRGPALVLLHGQAPGSCVEVTWSANIDYFAAAGFTVFAFDQVGFGRTDNPTDFSMAARVDHSRAFLTAMEVSSYVLWGASSGSDIAARIALVDPQVRGLVLMASGQITPPAAGESAEVHRRLGEELARYTPTRENARAYLRGTLAHPELASDELVERLLAMSGGKNFEAYVARQQAPRLAPVLDDLHQLAVPTLVLWGKSDRVDVRRSLLLHDAIPGAELHIFDRCGHWVQLDQADRANAIVREFLSRL